MRFTSKVYLLSSVVICGMIAVAQTPQKAPLAQGVSVQMGLAGHSVEMRAADEPNAKIVAITADGRVFVGIKAVDPLELGDLGDGTVFVKADARAPYQKVLSVLDSLRGKSVVLLTAAPSTAVKQGNVPPYGMKLTVSR